MSIIKKLREENKTNEEFEIMLSNLTLEQMFLLRLELEDKAFNGSLSGYKIYKCLSDIINEGLVRYALEFKKTKAETARFLGINIQSLEKKIKKFNIDVNK